MTVERLHESSEPVTHAAARIPRDRMASEPSEPSESSEPAAPDVGSVARQPGAPRLAIESVLDEDAAGRLLLATTDGGERVAIYFVRPGHADAARIERFLRDAAALRDVRHPGLVRVRGAGVERSDAGQQPFLVLDPPRDRLALAPLAHAEHFKLSPRKRIELFAAIADAVGAAHGRNVAIRGIRPGVIAVDEAGRVALRPVGIAAATAGDALATSMQRDVGHLIDAVPYLSPEQIDGEAEIDVRADVWALGVIGYELLSGQLPFDLVEREGTGGVEIVPGPGPARPPRPGAPPSWKPRSIRMVNRMYGAEIDAILGRALAVDRTRRYADAGALARDLRAHLGGRALSGRPRGRSVLQTLAPRPAALAILATVAILVLTSASIWWLLPAPPPPVEERVTLLSRTELEDSVVRAQEALDQADRERAASQLLADREREKRVDLEARVASIPGEIERAFASGSQSGQAEARKQAKIQIDALTQERDRALGAVDELSADRDGAVRASGRAEAWRAYVENELLPALAIAGDGRAHVDALEAAALGARRTLDGAPLLEAAAHLAIGRALAAAGESRIAERETSHALVLLERELPAGDPRVLQAMESVVEARRAALGREDPATLAAIHHLAATLAASGRAAEAEPLFLEALEGRMRLGEDHASARETRDALAELYESQGRDDEAAELRK